MYDMWAEHDPAADGRVLVWHVVSKDNASESLCGRALQPAHRATGGGDEDEDGAADRYCSPCMASVRKTMAAATTIR